MVLWLNSDSDPVDESTEADDGLKIFSDDIFAMLLSNGVSVKPAIHPDFLSSSSTGLNLVQGAPYLKLAGAAEIIPRKHNRMALLGSKRPFGFVSRPNLAARSTWKHFEKKTTLALVYIYTSQD